MNSQSSMNNAEMQIPHAVSTPVVPTNSTTNRQTSNANNRQNSTAPNGNIPVQTANPNAPLNINLAERQFSDLLGSLKVRQEIQTTFSTCSARFNGGCSTSKVEDFIATILVFKEAEHVSDLMALTSLPLLLEGYASSWWQGVKHEARTFDEAIELLRSAFAPPKPDWRIYAEIFQDKQKLFESTDSFICRKRCLFAQLKEGLPESTKINMVFSLLNIQIREKMSRESIETFQDLLSKARDIELLNNENNPQHSKKSMDEKNISQAKCSFCRKKNHTADVCYKRLEMEKKKKPEETKLNCYGCGALGFHRSNCPTCNYKTVLESPKEMDFHSIQTNLIGRNVPTVEINVNGLKGEAYLDTAARTSIAGHFLYKKLLEKKVKFQSVFAEITLADGISRKQNVYSTIVDIMIGNRLKRIRFICLPTAKDNRTLLGIDFLEQAGIVMDLAQRNWHYKDEPQKIFEFKPKPSKVKDDVCLNEANIHDNKPSSSNVSHINDFMSWFESNNKQESQTIPTLKSIYSPQNDYSPRGILKIFEDALPQNFEMPKENDVDLFPPLKKKRINLESPLTKAFELNAVDFNISENENSNVNLTQKENLIKLLKSYECVFNNISSPIRGIKHKIDTGNHTPITNPPYRISPAMKEKLKKELNDMLSKGIIEEKESPWAFPVVLIPKKDNSIRLCVDYRKLNDITVTDTYPLPRMEYLLHAAKTTPYMSTIDLKSGYWQIEMNEEDKLKTAFITPFGIYVFNRMPFGLKNAPATFQRAIDKIKSSLPNVLILVYIDDIIICSKYFTSHLTDLELTFNKLKAIGFHLNKEKCYFCKPKVKYLGHILTKDGIEIDPDKTSAILNRQTPKNLKQLMSFLQTCSWFRRFIPNFAEISKPLSNLTKKNVVWKWSTNENKSFLNNHLNNKDLLN
ncbi:uncharacterized protein LOC135950547 [Calliphora vicina]|uniref:uncharacterized protein LOC135950547 n=1 Tax=Calliphora vicina TaxID=7373 RepID=UPI00325ACC0C